MYARTENPVECVGDLGELCLVTLVETSLYRIDQEALVNVAHHARARHVVIALRRRSGAVRCCVCDDGIGFDPSRVDGGLGLLGIRERLDALRGPLGLPPASGPGPELGASLSLTQR